MLYSNENLEKIEGGYNRIMDIDLNDYTRKGQVRKVEGIIYKLEKLTGILFTMELDEENCISVEKICELIIRIKETINDSKKKLKILKLHEKGESIIEEQLKEKSVKKWKMIPIYMIKRIILLLFIFMTINLIFIRMANFNTIKIDGAYTNETVSHRFESNMFYLAKNMNYSDVSCEGTPRNKNIVVSVYNTDKDGADYSTYVSFDHKCDYHKREVSNFEMLFTDKDGNIKEIE